MMKTLTSLSLRFTHVWWRDDDEIDGKRCHRANGDRRGRLVSDFIICSMAHFSYRIPHKNAWFELLKCIWGIDLLVFSPFALWHLFPSTPSSSLHRTCVNRRDRLVSVFTICSMAPFFIYFINISSSYLCCVNRRDRLSYVFASCSMVSFSISFVIISSYISKLSVSYNRNLV